MAANNFAQQAPELLDSACWTLDLETDSGRVSSMSTSETVVIRFDVTVVLPNMPVEYMQHLLIRPETLASEHNRAMLPAELLPRQHEIVNHIAPGDVIINGWGTRPAQRKLIALLASACGKLYKFSRHEDYPLWRSSLIRDAPQLGDCMSVYTPCDQERFPYLSVALHCRNQGDHVARCTYLIQLDQAHMAFCVPEMQKVVFSSCLGMLYTMSSTLFNDPERPKLVALSQDLYVVLTMQGWKKQKRVLLLPTDQENSTVDVSSADGCKSYWKYVDEGADMGEYLESFFKHLFPDRQIRVYETLDGRQLVHYQRAIKKEDWDLVKPSFETAFLAHRSAFRRAYGGCIGPSLVDSRPARTLNTVWFSGDPQAEYMAMEEPVEGEVLVEQNTFLDFQESGITRASRRLATM